MGMNAVEIVLRTEGLYAITIPDEEASAIRPICSNLNLVPLPSPSGGPFMRNFTVHGWGS